MIGNIREDPARGFVTILVGSGPDRFRNAGDIPAGSDPRGIAAADFDEDGTTDLAVVGQRNDSRNVAIALGNGDGTFRPGLVTSVPNFPEFVSSADFNGDGHADLAVGAETSADAVQLTVRLGLGDGSFGHRITRLGGEHSPTGLAITDVNMDGWPDVVIVGTENGSDKGSISVFMDVPARGISKPKVSHLPFEPGGFATADLDGDGIPDLVVADFNRGGIGVMPGHGGGRFGPATTYPSPDGVVAVAVGDVTGDGILDIVVAYELGNVSVLAGEPGGTYAEPVTYANGVAPGAAFSPVLALANFDPDGRLDLAVVQDTQGNVAVLKQLAG